MPDVINLDDVRRAARKRLPRVVFDFIDGGADDEITMRRNRDAFESVVLRSRVLQGVAERDQSVTVLGERLETPVLLAPAGLIKMAHPRGEIAAAQAAAAHGTRYILSSNSSISIEDVAGGAPPSALWFLLALWRSRERNEELLRRARDAGYKVLVVMADVPVSGKRERDLRNRFTIPLRPNASMVLDVARHPRWFRNYLKGGPITFANFTGMAQSAGVAQLFEWVDTELAHPGATFDDLAWLRERWQGPIVLKGVMTGEDARAAVACGMDGIVVSNHGGRQLDGVSSTIEVLEEVVEAVAGQADVLLDGGIRRGGDVVKALALGAKAVLIGRPYCWGLGMGGREGVSRVLEILEREIDLTLALLGEARLTDVSAASVDARWTPGRAPGPSALPAGRDA